MRRHKRRSNENSPAWQDNLSSFSRERERGPMRPLEVSPPPVGAQLQAAKSTRCSLFGRSAIRRYGHGPLESLAYPYGYRGGHEALCCRQLRRLNSMATSCASSNEWLISKYKNRGRVCVPIWAAHF